MSGHRQFTFKKPTSRLSLPKPITVNAPEVEHYAESVSTTARKQGSLESFLAHPSKPLDTSSFRAPSNSVNHPDKVATPTSVRTSTESSSSDCISAAITDPITNYGHELTSSQAPLLISDESDDDKSALNDDNDDIIKSVLETEWFGLDDAGKESDKENVCEENCRSEKFIPDKVRSLSLSSKESKIKEMNKSFFKQLPCTEVPDQDKSNWINNMEYTVLNEVNSSRSDDFIKDLQLKMFQELCDLLSCVSDLSWGQILNSENKNIVTKILSLRKTLLSKSRERQNVSINQFIEPVASTSRDNNFLSRPSTSSVSPEKRRSSLPPPIQSAGASGKSSEESFNFSPPANPRQLALLNLKRKVAENKVETETQIIVEEDTQDMLGAIQVSVSEDVAKARIVGRFRGNFKDDGSTNEFKGNVFPHTQEMRKTFHRVFGLKKFRHNQLEAINACLLGNDCFILMPTGGGKSLCYQLPALVTKGITIVISPLRSLIQDQVQRLCSFDISAAHLSGELESAVETKIYNELRFVNPTLKLLYVTPEKLSSSTRLQNALDNLYKRQLLARFVIDEAHCISQWGHDFRPDYKRLSCLREKYPGVPLMALTATATERVRHDILNELKMPNPKWFLQSFNRPNLKYEVVPKQGKGMAKGIVEFIKSRYPRSSGIVYCLSRNECACVARELTKEGVPASEYHAGLDGRKRWLIQENWLNDKFKVICATIAFGMGIDKPNVRFVIHNSLPKSMEGYYQESGRAGRDGEISTCILYYSFNDMHRIRRMIEGNNENFECKKIHILNLNKIVQYCENLIECRRVQQLEYLGELFDKALCKANPQTACDNCLNKECFSDVDLTEDAKVVVEGVKALVGDTARRKVNITTVHLVDIFKGSKNQKTLSSGHDSLPMHGKGASYRRNDAERLLHKLVISHFLHEDVIITAEDHACAYVRTGPRANDLLAGRARVMLSLRSGSKQAGSPHVGGLNVEGDNSIQKLQTECYDELVEECKKMAVTHNMHYTNVINPIAIRQMSQDLPMTDSEMLAIPHVTKANFDKYGKNLLEITSKYGALKVVMLAEQDEMAQIDSQSDDGWVEQSDNHSPYFRTGNSYRGKRKYQFNGNKKGYKRRKVAAKPRLKATPKAKTKVNAPTESQWLSKNKTKSTSSSKKLLPVPQPSSRTFLPTPKVYKF